MVLMLSMPGGVLATPALAQAADSCAQWTGTSCLECTAHSLCHWGGFNCVTCLNCVTSCPVSGGGGYGGGYSTPRPTPTPTPQPVYTCPGGGTAALKYRCPDGTVLDAYGVCPARTSSVGGAMIQRITPPTYPQSVYLCPDGQDAALQYRCPDGRLVSSPSCPAATPTPAPTRTPSPTYSPTPTPVATSGPAQVSAALDCSIFPSCAACASAPRGAGQEGLCGWAPAFSRCMDRLTWLRGESSEWLTSARDCPTPSPTPSPTPAPAPFTPVPTPASPPPTPAAQYAYLCENGSVTLDSKVCAGGPLASVRAPAAGCSNVTLGNRTLKICVNGTKVTLGGPEGKPVPTPGFGAVLALLGLAGAAALWSRGRRG